MSCQAPSPRTGLVGGSVICVKSAQGFGYVPTAKFYLGVFWPLTLVSLVLKNCNMHPYGQYCPVARAAEILADRWTLLIVRELLADVRHFNELERGLPHISRTLLAERLRRLEQMRVLERRATSRGRPTEYRLTAAGRELQQIIDQFGEWGARWAFGPPRPNELDPIILLWWMRRRVAADRISRPRVVIQFDFRRAPPQSYWLLIEPNDVSVCLKDPGFDVDVIVTSDVMTFYQVWLGRLSLANAVRRKLVHLDGAPTDIRAFPNWFTWSPMADSVRAALADRRTSSYPTVPPNDRSMKSPAASIKASQLIHSAV